MSGDLLGSSNFQLRESKLVQIDTAKDKDTNGKISKPYITA